MKIGLVIYGSLDTITGGYIYDRKLVDYLLKNGDSVEIISLPNRNYFLHITDNLNSSLKKRIADLKIDLLIEDELNHPSLFLCNRVLTGKQSRELLRNYPFKTAIEAAIRPPIISIVHHLRSSELRLSLLNNIYSKIEQQYLSGVDYFIFNSQSTRNDVENLGINLANYKYLIAHPGGDRLKPAITDDFVKNRANDTGTFRLLFIGNLIPRKGLLTLLMALTETPDESCYLDVVGSHEFNSGYARKVQKFVSTQALNHRVKFYGSLEDHELVELLKTDHLLVLPSTHEGFGIVYLEAMGFGIPSIGTTSGGASEVIDHGKNGLLIKPGDSRTLGKHISELSHNREKLCELSLAALDKYRTFPTWETTCNQIRNFLLRVTGSL